MPDLLSVAVSALLAGLGGFLVPRLIRAVPQPARQETPPGEPEPPTYAEVAARPRLALRSLVVAVLVMAPLAWCLGAAGERWPLLWLVPLVPVAIALSVIDWKTRLLPRLIVLPAIGLTLVAMTVVGLATDHTSALVRALVAMLLVRTLFWLLWFVRSAGMGFGDVRLAGLVGLVLGWQSVAAVLVGVWVGFAGFALPALVLAVVRRDRSLLKRSFPFGPFMLAGAWVGLVYDAVFLSGAVG